MSANQFVLHLAVVDLDNLFNSNHKHPAQIFTQLCESLTAIISTIFIAIDFFRENMSSKNKEQKLTTEINTTMLMLHDHVKAQVAMQLVFPTEVFQIFPHTYIRFNLQPGH